MRSIRLGRGLNAPVVAAALLLAGASVARGADSDTGETIEVQFTSSIAAPLAAKAAELGSVVAIYEYVRNGSEFALYHGARSGSVNTFLGRRGNDVDLAATLIAMLRSRGFHARYAVATVRASAKAVAGWLGVKDATLAYQLLRDVGIQNVGRNGADGTIDLEHVWVEVQVPARNYRGGGSAPSTCGATPGACPWFALDPSFRQRVIRSSGLDPAPRVPFDYAAYYDAIKNDDPLRNGKNPLEIWENQILDWLQANAPGKTLEDIPDVLAAAPREDGLVPASLPYSVVGPIRRYSSMADHDAAVATAERFPGAYVERVRWMKRLWLRTKVLAATGQPVNEVGVFPLVTLASQRLTLSTEGVNVVARLGGDFKGYPLAVVPGYVPKLGDPFSIIVATEAAPDPDNAKISSVPVQERTYDAIVGGFYAVATGGETSNWTQVHAATQRLLDAGARYRIVFKPGEAGCAAGGARCTPYVDLTGDGWDPGDPRLSDHPAALEALTGGLLEVAATQYCATLREATARLDALAKTRTPISSFLGVLSTTQRVEYIDGTAFSVMPGGLLIDIHFNVAGAWRIDAPAVHSDEQFKLLGHVASSLEHEVWQELTGYDSISTVRALQLTRAKGNALKVASFKGAANEPVLDYSAFGYQDAPPAPFASAAINGDLYGTYPQSWSHPTQLRDDVFEILARWIAGPTDLRRKPILYLNDDYQANIACFARNRDLVAAYANSPGATFRMVRCVVNVAGSYSYAAADRQNRADYAAYTAGDWPAFLDGARGFFVQGMVYRRYDAARRDGLLPIEHVWSLRDALLLEGPPGAEIRRDLTRTWVEHLVPTALVDAGGGRRFAVGITTTHEAATGMNLVTSYWIFDESLANGGYVIAPDPLDPASATGGAGAALPSFDPALFTDQNTIAVTNNDLTKTPSTSDPVSTVTGNNFHDETDLVVKGRGVGFAFTRTYNSAASSTRKDGPLGHGWTHSYGMQLTSNDYGECPACPPLPRVVGNPVVARAVASDGAANVLVVGAAAVLPQGSLRAIKVFNQGPSAASFNAYVLRPTGAAGQYQVVFDSGPLTVPAVAATAARVETFSVGPVAVRAGDVLAHYGRGIAYDNVSANADAVYYPATAAPPAGGTISLGSTAFPAAAIARTYSIAAELTLPGARPENGTGKTSSVTYTDERGGEHSYLVDEGTGIVTPPKGEFNSLQLNTPVIGEHVITFRNGVRYVFEGQSTLKTTPGITARLARIEDPWGNRVTLAYGASGRLESVTDNLLGSSGRSLAFAYDGRGHLATVSDWSGRTWTYDVDANGDLLSAKNPLSQTTRYTYVPGTHNLFEVKKPLQRSGREVKTAFTYYQNGRAFHYSSSLGEFELLDYDLFRRSTRVTDPRGGVREYQYDERGALTKLVEPDGAVLRFANNATDGLRYKKTDGLGYATTYSYRSDRTFGTASDTGGNITRERDPLGYTVDVGYGPYDQIASQKDKRGTVRTTTFHAATDAVCGAAQKPDQTFLSSLSGVRDVPLEKYCWNGDGTLKSRTEYVEPGKSSSYRRTDVTYEPGNLNVRELAVTGFDGATISSVVRSFTYDGLGRKKTETVRRRKSPTDPTPVALTTTYSYDALDRVTMVEDAVGNRLETVFDANGQVECVRGHYRLPNGTYDTRTLSQRFYDAADRLIEERDVYGNPARYAYDASGNLTSVTDRNGHVTRYEYDPMNRRTAVVDGNGSRSEIAYDHAGRAITVTNANGESVTSEHDALGRVTRVTDAKGYVMEYAFDPNGNVTCVVDANAQAGLQPRNSRGCSESREYDELNRVVRIADARDGVTALTYDLLGNRTSVTDAGLKQTQFHYDGLGRLVWVQDPGGLITRYDRDEAGNAYRITNRMKQVTLVTFDPLNRAQRFEYVADGVVETTDFDPYGNVSAVANPNVRYAFAYDLKGRLGSRADSRGRTTSYGYDPEGNVTSRSDQMGGGLARRETATFQYDSANRLVALRSAEYLDGRYQYDAAGRLVARTLSNGARTEYRWDEKGQLARLRIATGDGSVLSDTTYTRDRVGNIETATDANGKTTYTYDPLYRLTNVDYPGTTPDEAVSYDAVGNRLSRTDAQSQFYEYYPNTNRVWKVHTGSWVGPARTFSYDDEGRLVAQSSAPGVPSIGRYATTIAWDQKNRATSMTSSDGTVSTFKYDPLNYRIARSGGSVGAKNYFLQGEHLDAEWAGTVLQATYFRGASTDELLAGYSVGTGSGTLVPAIYHHDHLTSVTGVSTHDGHVKESVRYGAWGNVLSSTGASANRLRYTGREYDADTQLYYYRARYYDPGLGRFISEDPLGFDAGDSNFYVYVRNNPVNATDPSGLIDIVYFPGNLGPNNPTWENAVPGSGLRFMVGTRLGDRYPMGEGVFERTVQGHRTFDGVIGPVGTAGILETNVSRILASRLWGATGDASLAEVFWQSLPGHAWDTKLGLSPREVYVLNGKAELRDYVGNVAWANGMKALGVAEGIAALGASVQGWYEGGEDARDQEAIRYGYSLPAPYKRASCP